MGRFEEITIGDKAEFTHVITQSDIERFVELTGDDNKLHVDEEYASKTTYKKPVVHGMLGVSFISTIIGTKLPGDGALWFAQSLEFLLPVWVGDTITVKAEVINKIGRTRIIELATTILNQDKQKVTTGNAKVKMIEQEAPLTDKEPKRSTKRVALVIGGSGGIGKATCLQLAKDGFDVAIHYHQNRESAEKTKEQIVAVGKKAIHVRADITNFEQVQEMVATVVRRFGTITIIANCATVRVPNIKFGDLEWESIQDQFDINTKGAFNILKCVVPVMDKEKYGKIINITTQYIESPRVELTHYIMAKSALHGFTKALAVELAPKGIRVNMVSPGMTETELIANVPEKVRLLTAVQAPLKRIAKPEDVAGAISYLASEKSDYLTGETIRVNGGQVML